MENCLIWDAPATVNEGSDETVADSVRAGGRYVLSGSARSSWANLPEADRASLRPKLTTWIIDQHRSGVEEPLIDSYVIEALKDRRRLRHSERVRRFFLMLIDQGFRVSDSFQVSGAVSPKVARTRDHIAAWIDADSYKEVYPFLELLRDSGLLKKNADSYLLTASGFERLEQEETGSTATTQAFVAMWFTPEMDEIYHGAIAPAIEEAGYKPFRIDQKEHNNKIDDEIIAEIRRSRFVVADFTCATFEVGEKRRSEARGGVYYEAGFAQGLGMPLIWSVRSDCIDLVHFDTRQFSHIVWDGVDDLRLKLRNRIRASIL